MKKVLCISIFFFACSETLPVRDSAISKDAGSEDASVDLSTGKDSSRLDVRVDLGDVSQDSGQDLSLDSSSDDVSTDMRPDLAVRVPRGTCESDADCTDGTCVTIGDEITGWKTCAKRFPERTQCDEVFDDCCKSEDCTNGANGVCLSPLPICSGVRPQTHNLCYYDDCATDSDCTQEDAGVCIPGGAFGEGASTCFYGGCRVDADCNDGEEGECIPFSDPCANRHEGFYCVYKDSQCRIDKDCKGRMEYCAPGKKGTSCEPFRPPA